MGYECYQIVRFESRHYNDFNDFEKKRFGRLHDLKAINFYQNDKGKEVVDVLIGRRSLECPISDISSQTDWEELNLFYHIWLMGFGKNTDYRYNLYFYDNGGFKNLGQPVFTYNRIRIYIDKQGLVAKYEEKEIIQNYIVSIIGSEMIIDLPEKCEYTFSSVPFGLYDITKIDLLYQIYGNRGIIVDALILPINIKDTITRKLLYNAENIDETFSEILKFVTKVEVFHHDEIVFLSLPQKAISSSETEFESQDFLIIKWANMINKEWLRFKMQNE
jgi:hypothetical protein